MFLLSALGAQADAQVRFGLILDETQSRTLNQDELQFFQRLGFSILIPEGHFSPEIFSTLAGSGMEVWPALPLRYHTRNTPNPDAAQMLAYIRPFEQLPAFNGIVVSRHADLRSQRTSAYLAKLTDHIRERYPAQRLFMVTRGVVVPSPLLLPVADASLFMPGAPFDGAPLLMPFAPKADEHHFFAKTVREGIQKGYGIFLTDYDNLNAYLDDDFSGFAEILSGFRSSADPSIPLPPKERMPQSINYGIFLLIGLWLSFAVHLRFNPNYSRTAGRYFFSHSFLVEDILRRHILLSGSVFVVFLQIALMWGLFVHTFATAFLGEAGMSALTYYYPFASNEVVLFVLGVIWGAFLNAMLWAWLIITCFRRDIVSISGTLLFWPAHLNFFILLALFTLSGAGAGPLPVLFTGAAFLLVQFGAFFAAAFAFSRQPTLKPVMHLLLTVLLYTSFVGLLVILIIRNSTLYGVFQLAFWLNN